MHDGFVGLNDRLDILSHQFGELQMSLNTQVPQIDRKQILTWLDAVLTDEDYERALSARLDGTCNWILRRHEIQNWAKPNAAYDSNRVLWIHGSPGFGKTILCARLIEHVSQINTLPVAHFFCVGANDAKRQPQAIMRSWIAQLVNQNEDALTTVGDFYNRKAAQRATESDIWQMFKLVNSNIGTCFFAIDGYDECLKLDLESKSVIDGRAKFLQELVAVVKGLGCRVLLVSRNEPDIRNELSNDSEGPDPDLFLEYEITCQDTEDDIKNFSNSVVQRGIPNKPSALKNEIASEAALKCEGMFLWIRLMHERLSPGKNAKQLREVVRATPPGLDKAYERDIRNIADLETDERERAIAILRWTLFAERPLTVREMTEALLIRDDDEEDTFPEDDLPDAWDEYYTNDQIKRLCGSLIELRSTDMHEPIEDQTIQFVHFSVKEYLLRTIKPGISSQTIDFSDAVSEQSYLARACLRYLCYQDFNLGRHSTSISLQDIMKRYAFYKYAAQSWFYNLFPIEGYTQDHIIPKESYSQDLITSINKFFDSRAHRWLLWSEVLETMSDSSEAFQENCKDGYGGPQYYAAMIGLTRTLEYLREQGVDLNTQGGRFGNALQVATINGHRDTIEYLLSNNADVNLEGGEHGSAIVAAAAAYNVKEAQEIIRLLLRKGADIESKDKNKKTALHHSSRYGTLPVFQLLLENGADVKSVSDFGQTALHVASVYGRENAVQTLVKYGSDIHHVDNAGWTALHVAAFNGHTSVCKILLDLGANVNWESEKQFLTALHEAAFKGHTAVVELLLNKGAGIQSETNNGGTALHLAAYHGHEATTRLLIHRGAKVNAKNKNGWTPLHEITSNVKNDDHENTVQTLIAGGADVNATNNNGETALNFAIGAESETIVSILLKNKANYNVADNDQWTPVHIATAMGNEKILQLLLDSGANVDAKSNSGWTPLSFAADRGHEKILLQLLKAGANPNIQTGMNQTPLHKAVYHGSIPIIESLLSHGADPLLVDGFGRSSMDWAASDPKTLNLMRRYCKTYTQPDPTIASNVLRHTILETLTKLKSTSDYSLQIRLLNQVGRCLLLIHDVAEARRAFELAIMPSPHDGGAPMHYAVCGTCKNEDYIRGERFLCLSCAEIDACEACMEKHLRGGFVLTCRGHGFLKVPGEGWGGVGGDLDVGIGVWVGGLGGKYF